MDLDFKSVKALSSPTRIKILNKLLDKEATTTKLADELGKSKSTISDHLKVLTDSELIDKDEEEGRRRVVYRPTDSAKAIVEGRERKVKFSIASSAITGLLGVYLLKDNLKNFIQKPEPQANSADLMMQSAEASTSAAQNSQMTEIEMALIVLGGGLLVTAIVLAVYTFILKKLEG